MEPPRPIAVAAVFREGRLLVQRRRRGETFVHELPCGKAEAGERFVDAAVRELAEETALAATPTGVPQFELTATNGAPIGFVSLVVSPEAEPAVTDPAREQTFFWMTPREIVAAPFFIEWAPTDRAFVMSLVR